MEDKKDETLEGAAQDASEEAVPVRRRRVRLQKSSEAPEEGKEEAGLKQEEETDFREGTGEVRRTSGRTLAQRAEEKEDADSFSRQRRRVRTDAQVSDGTSNVRSVRRNPDGTFDDEAEEKHAERKNSRRGEQSGFAARNASDTAEMFEKDEAPARRRRPVREEREEEEEKPIRPAKKKKKKKGPVIFLLVILLFLIGALGVCVWQLHVIRSGGTSFFEEALDRFDDLWGSAKSGKLLSEVMGENSGEEPQASVPALTTAAQNSEGTPVVPEKITQEQPQETVPEIVNTAVETTAEEAVETTAQKKNNDSADNGSGS